MFTQKLIGICKGITYWAIIAVPFMIILGLGLANAVIVTAIISFFIAKVLGREKILVDNKVALAYGVLVFCVLLSFKNTLYLHESIKGLQRWLIEYPLLLLAVSGSVKDTRHLRLIVISIAVSAAVVSIDAVWQLLSGKDFIWGNAVYSSPIGLARPSASFNGPNLLGIYLSMLTPILGGIALFYKNGKMKIFMLLGFFLGALGVFLTLSRGAGLGLWLALLFLAIVKRNRILAAILIAALLIYPFVMPKSIRDWARNVKYNPVVFLFNYDRLSMHRNTINMIKHYPIVGVGINTFSKNYAKYKLPEAKYEITGDTTYAHNIYLHTAGEIGLLGLAALLFFLFSLFKQGAVTYSKLKDEYLKILSVSLMAGFIAFLVNGMTETSLYYPTVVVTFWFLAGVSLSLRKFV